MSIESLGGVAASAAGSPRAQNTGTDVERTHHDAADRQRQIDADLQADSAAGIAETDGQDLEANDRDADGRRAWEIGSAKRPGSQPPQFPPNTSENADDSRGASLDLTG